MNVQNESQLLSNVGTMLNYTADEISEDKTLRDKLKLIIKNGKERLRSRAPDLTDEDFTKAGKPQELLFSYARYANSDAEEMFNINHSDELLALRFQYEVRAYNEDQNES